MGSRGVDRREFLRQSMRVGAGLKCLDTSNTARKREEPHTSDPPESSRMFNGWYQAPYTDQIAFPMGGIGAGMICLQGSGALSRFALRHNPELERDYRVFGALSVVGKPALARVLEGPVPQWKLHPRFPEPEGDNCWGLPRFHHAAFQAQFPFGIIDIWDDDMPLGVTLLGWSPFFPGDPDDSSLPVAALEYRFVNRSRSSVEAIFSFNAENFLAISASAPPSADTGDRIRAISGGFVLFGAGSPKRPWDEGYCAAWVNDPLAKVSYGWPAQSLDVLWRRFAAGECQLLALQQDRSAVGASIFVPFKLKPGESKTVIVSLAWFVPSSDLFEPEMGFKDGKLIAYSRPARTYRPWYVGRFPGIAALAEYWCSHYSRLKEQSQLFSRTLQDSSLPPEITEAVCANLCTLKSTTVLRQDDGRLWGWEGSYAESSDGDRTAISGTTTHVWNYAQAIPHLFPALERGLRETEFGSNQNEEGLQYCRTPLPIRPVEPGHSLPDGPAADGQLGGIIKVHREWRICGDTSWLRRLWPSVRASLDYCIRTWDPQHQGWLKEPHLTTYDMEFWGAESLCTSLYIGALESVIAMGHALNSAVDLYSELLAKAVKRMEVQLFNGEYFIQRVEWRGLRASIASCDTSWSQIYGRSQDVLELIRKEGPPGQYGTGCLSDGVMGMWLGRIAGLQTALDPRKIESHLMSVYRYNFRRDLTANVNLVRATFACNDEAGLLVCSWPAGGRPSLPLIYADEVWTGIEYQVACHLIMCGKIDAGLELVRAARRRYDGRVRNPFDEIEAGHWYARAMSSYALLQAMSGARFDAVDKVLYLRPAIKGDFRCFLATETGFGTVGVKRGEPFLEIASGNIPYKKIEYTAA